MKRLFLCSDKDNDMPGFEPGKQKSGVINRFLIKLLYSSGVADKFT